MNPRWVHNELLWFKIIIFIVSNVHLVLSDGDESFCYVPFDSPAIILNTTKGKDTNYRASKFDHHAQLLNIDGFKATNSDWALVNNIVNASEEQKIEDFVLDHRWEKFICNNDAMTKKLKESKFSLYFSLKNYPDQNIFDWTSVGWHHVHIKKESNDDIVLKEHGKLDITLKQKELYQTATKEKNIWKIHDYNYFHSKIPSSKHVIHNRPSKCGNFQERCLYFYLAMCQNCTFNITIESNSSTSRIFKPTHARKWKQEKLCHKMTECLNISVGTENHGSDNNFWAIGTEIHLSNCTNGSRYLSYIKKETWIQGCESPSSTIEIKTGKIPKCPKNESHKSSSTATNKLDNANTELQVIHLRYYLIAAIAICLLLTASVGAYFMWRKYNRTFKIPPISDREEFGLIPLEPEPIKPVQQLQTCVKRIHFESWVQRSLKEDLRLQYEALPNNSLSERGCGQQEENLRKNRYTKIIPYDYNRVVLHNNFSHVDYINASYIQGYFGLKEYIVTQEPLEHTMSDFWLMIWQENIKYILLLTNGKMEKWPQKHGRFEIKLTKTEKYEFHSLLHLQVKKDKEIRILVQLQYEAFVDPPQKPSQTPKPYFSYSLVQYINESLKIPHDDKSPVLVYSRGLSSDPSGLVILCDMALREVVMTGQIDMFKIAKKLRTSRYNLLENLNQYQLAHLVVLECLNYGNPGVRVDEDFDMDLTKWDEDRQKLYQELHQLKWIDQALVSYTRNTQHDKKNRYLYKRPVVHSQVLLQYVAPDFINAHYVDSYRRKNRFIVTQHPLEQTVADFWIMILQNNVSLIIILDDVAMDLELYPKYFPRNQNDTVKPMAGTELLLTGNEEHSCFNEITIILRQESAVKNQFTNMNITILLVKNWERSKEIPNNEELFISLWKETKKADNKAHVVCCDDGVTCCGLWVAFSYLVERMLQEKVFDISGAVRAVRRSHPDFITSEKQFFFLIQCALLFYKTHIMKPSRPT